MSVHACCILFVFLEHGAVDVCKSPLCTENVGPSTTSVIPIHPSLRASVAGGTARYSKRFVCDTNFKPGQAFREHENTCEYQVLDARYVRVLLQWIPVPPRKYAPWVHNILVCMHVHFTRAQYHRILLLCTQMGGRAQEFYKTNLVQTWCRYKGGTI